MSTEEFDLAWAELSLIQRQAADWNEGSLLVLAGPGSGKTRVLTCRIARILDSNPDKNFRILGLTFTNKAADEMRVRVEKYVPGHERRIFLGTFHSFCADVLRQHGMHLGINPNFTIYSQDNELQEVLNEAVEEARHRLELVQKVHKKTLPVIFRLKSLLVSPEDCQGRFDDPEFGKVMAAVYSAYEAQLAKRNALDFNSLIFKAYQLFKSFPAFAKRYRNVYPYICVDEFQDTNQAQYGFLRALCGDAHRNVFVVADDDQIIYQWNGASHKRINEFINDYSANILQLPTNYRCPREIVELANNLIRHNFLRRPDKAPTQAFRSASGKASVRLMSGFATFDDEMAEIARDIKKLHLSHLGSVAVLARSRRLLEGSHQALSNEGLPSVISQRKDEFESLPLMWLHAVLRLQNDKQNRGCIETVCGAFEKITRIDSDVENVVTQARASNLGYLNQWTKEIRRRDLGEPAKEIIDLLLRFITGSINFLMFSRYWLERIEKIRQNQQIQPDPSAQIFEGYQEERPVWDGLVAEITRSLGDDLTLEAFLQELEMHSKEIYPGPDTIILMTIHGAKGREFDHVYLIGLVEDEIPSFQSKQKGTESPEMEEERRNCFVAITRTIETLTVSYAERYSGWSKKPSRFLFEMGILENEQT